MNDESTAPRTGASAVPVVDPDDRSAEEMSVEAASGGVPPMALGDMFSGRAAAWAAAILLAVGILGGVAGAALTQRQASSTRTASDLTQVALDAATSPAARSLELKGGADVLAKLVLLPDGTGYLVPRDLPPLGPDRTYQLWGVQGQRVVSLAVLGPRPGVTAFHVPSSSMGALLLTNEPQPGSVQPTTQVSTGQL